MHTLFVYGALKQGEHISTRLNAKRPAITFVGPDVLPDYTIMLAGYIAVMMPHKGKRVLGEIVKVDDETRQEIDRIEWGYNPACVTTLNGVKAITYVGQTGLILNGEIGEVWTFEKARRMATEACR